MYFYRASTALFGLAIGVQSVAAGPCKPESSQTLTESSLSVTSSVSDPALTATSMVSSTETTQSRPENDNSSTVSLDSSSAEIASATTTSNTESVSRATEFSETSTALPSTTKETAEHSIPTEISESSTILPTTTEETPSTSAAPANEQPQIFTGGSATWVFQNGIMGDCGSVSHDTDFVVALDYRRYDRSKCGQKIRVTATSGRHIGLSIDVTIVDACYVCVNENSMDLSTGAFNVFGTLDDARVNVEWQYLP